MQMSLGDVLPVVRHTLCDSPREIYVPDTQGRKWSLPGLGTGKLLFSPEFPLQMLRMLWRGKWLSVIGSTENALDAAPPHTLNSDFCAVCILPR